MHKYAIIMQNIKKKGIFMHKNTNNKSDHIGFTYDKGIEEAVRCYKSLSTLKNIDTKRIGIME